MQHQNFSLNLCSPTLWHVLRCYIFANLPTLSVFLCHFRDQGEDVWSVYWTKGEKGSVNYSNPRGCVWGASSSGLKSI